MAAPRQHFRQRMIPVDYEDLSVGAAAVSLVKAATLDFTAAWVYYESGPIRIRLDGTAPTPSVGPPMFDGGVDFLTREEAMKLQAIRQGVTNGTIRCHYYRAV